MLIWSTEGLAAMKRGSEALAPVAFLAALNRAEELARREFLTVPGIRYDYQVEARHWRASVDEGSEAERRA